MSESEEKHLKLKVKQQICGSLKRMRIRQSLPQPSIPQTGTQVPWNVQAAGSNPRTRAAVECRETGGGDVREETVVRNASRGKPGSHGSMVIPLSHTQGVEPSP